MKSKLKKITKFFMSLLLGLSTVVGSSIPTKAATYNLTEEFMSGWTYNGATTKHGTGTHMWVNGDDAWCLEPQNVSKPGSQNIISPDDIGISSSKMDDLALIVWYGYRSKSHTETNYVLTQNLIWKEVGSPQRLLNSSAGYGSESAMQSWFDGVMDKVDHFYDLPSFNGKTYTVDMGKTLSIEDNKKILSGLKVKSVTGGTAVISGNTLKITPNGSVDNMKISFNRGMTTEQTETNFVVKASGQDEYGRPWQAVSPCTGRDPYTANVTVNVNRYGSLKITKKDEDGTKVPNVSFKLSKNADMSSPIGTYKTGSNGTVTVDNLSPMDYYIQEVSVPSHLVLDNTIRKITIQPNQTTAYTANNVFVVGKIQLIKKDSENGKQVAGATYAIYDSSNREVERLVTTASGSVESGYLRFGSYTVKEVIAPLGYVLDNTIYPVTISQHEQRITVTGKDSRVKGSIELSKVDESTGTIAQGDGTLQGAVYGLYAKNPILDPADGSVKYVKHAEVARMTTDKNAKASLHDLYLGEYYLKEITPSDGYNLDTTSYDVTLSYGGQTVSIITKSQTVKERVISQAFSIIKVSNNGAAESDLIQGAEFTVKYKKDVEKAGSWENAPIARNAEGKPSAVLVTDKKGYAVSERLPIGTYIVRETRVPADHIKTNDFEVVIAEDSSEPQVWRVFNDEKFKAVLSIVKEDAETGNTVKLADTEFKIKNLDTNEYVGFWVWNPIPHYVTSWKTNESGTVMTDDALTPARYQLEEIKSPYGYFLNTEPVPFEISANTPYQTLPDGTTPLITVKQKDTSVKGQLLVSKEGEVLVSADKTGDGVQFHYETRKLKDAVFEIYAAEDIYSADNNKTLLYHKGQFIDTMTTNVDGVAASDELPLGSYQIKEKTAPNGFVHSDEIKKVKLSYADQTTAVVFGDAGIVQNERQKVQVSAMKRDAITQEGVAGAHICLYANRDIYNFDGKVIVEAGTCIQTVVTDKDGKGKFTIDLPNDLTPPYAAQPIDEVNENPAQAIIEDVKLIGNTNELFYVTETKAPIGYVTGQKVRHYFGTLYTNQQEPILKFTFDFQNAPTKVLISKTDITGEKELAGAHLEIIDKNTNRLMASWISDGKEHTLERLPIGQYLLKETQAPDGYTTAMEVPFEIKDDTNVQRIQMKDDVTHMQFIKTDENGTPQKGNILAVFDEQGKQIAQWETEEEPYSIDGLTVGKTYELREQKAIQGYTIAEPIRFIVKDTRECVRITMKNHKKAVVKPRKPVSVQTGDASGQAGIIWLLLVSFVFCCVLLKKAKRNTE